MSQPIAHRLAATPWGRLIASRASLIFVVLVAAAIGACNHFVLRVPLINDEAVELSQGTGISLHNFHFLSTPETYPESKVDQIETLVAYLSAITSRIGWSGGLTPSYTWAIRGWFLAAYIGGVLVFTLGMRRLWGNLWAAVAGVMIASSSFILITNHILTRNAFTFLWSSCALLVVVRWLGSSRPESARPTVRAAAWLGVWLVAGCWTYTSFRLFSFAVMVALVCDWLRFDRTRRGALLVLYAGLVFGGLLAILIFADGISLRYFLGRGGYALSQISGYLHRFALTLSSPWYYVQESDAFFLIEDVHILVGKPTLSLGLAPFFVLGGILAWARGERLPRFAVTCWMAGMALCAMAGPNAKYLVVFFPLEILLSIFGLRESAAFLLNRKFPRAVVASLGGALLLGVVVSEIRDTFVRFPQDRRHQMNRVPEKFAEQGLKLASQDYARVYLQPGLGYDIVVWKMTREHPALSSHVLIFQTVRELRAGMTRFPPPNDSVLLIDYPQSQLASQRDGWVLPPQVAVIELDRR